MLELRKYQEEVLDDLQTFLDKMIVAKQEEDEYNEYRASKNKSPEQRNLAALAWEAIGKSNYTDRKNDKTGQSIPHICLKVPTGGGKTLLATHAAKMINQYYFRRNTGLILWVVPSDAIYQQTLKAFKDPEHPYRQVLDMAAPRKKAKIFERHKHGIFSPNDVENDLSVLLLMVQAAGRENKETLRMFQDNGEYMEFFPDTNNHHAHQELLNGIPNLCFHEDESGKKTVKYSLGNVLKMLRPIIVLDEGHTATSTTRRETFNDFNPRFILELSATPPKDYSNVLVDVSGATLKAEEMIKLPIQLKNHTNDDWRMTLSYSCERLEEIAKQAKTYMGNGGQYIRPIMVVRVENTGKNQRGKGSIHADDVREYLTTEIGFREDEVRIKTSEMDEISKENLLSTSCPVRVIITKDALKEGWDCPFAYVLTLLDKTRSLQTLTQLIGRVLRQPHAQRTGIDALDRSHVFCSTKNVKKLVDIIKNSLEHHGLKDLERGSVFDEDKEEKELVKRRKQFKGLEIPLPQVFYREKGKIRLLDYDGDILSNINWGALKHNQTNLPLESKQEVVEKLVDVFETNEVRREEVMIEGEASEAFFARHLTDIVPNPWQAMRIAEEALSLISKQRIPQNIYNNRMDIVEQMRSDIEEQKEVASRTFFINKLKSNDIVFKLDATNSSWKLPQKITLQHVGKRKYLRRETDEQLSFSLFENYSERDFNEFEQRIAGYLDGGKALKWWHRVAARKEYGLQGWRKHLVYPDFLAFISKDRDKDSSLILETKGSYLSGNEDTEYKKKLFDLLEKSYTDIGDVSISGVAKHVMLRIIYDKDDIGWKQELDNLVNSYGN